MGRFISATSIAELSDEDSARIITEVETKALLAVPELDQVTDADRLTTIDSMLIRVTNEWVREAAKISQQTIGPWSYSFVAAAVQAGELATADKDWLRKLAGLPMARGVVPLGSYPAAPNLDYLFASNNKNFRGMPWLS